MKQLLYGVVAWGVLFMGPAKGQYTFTTIDGPGDAETYGAWLPDWLVNKRLFPRKCCTPVHVSACWSTSFLLSCGPAACRR